MRNLVVVACLVGCAAYTQPVAPPTPEIAAHHADAIRAAAADFTSWERVDEHLNLSPWLCRAPTREEYGVPSHLRMSGTKRGPHGRKLYYLWANDKDAYLDANAEPSVGFAIVKESFAAILVDPAHPPHDPHAGSHRLSNASESNLLSEPSSITPHAIAWVATDWGEKLTTGERADLFVMVKLGDAPGTDHGWIYGTVAPDGTVTSAGQVASCMSCHVKYPRRERLFGLRPAGQ